MANLLPQSDPPLITGARSQNVAQLQNLLTLYGFQVNPIDGIAGPATMRAVESAFVALSQSPSVKAREIAAAGPAIYPTVSSVIAALTAGFQQDALAKAGSDGGAPSVGEETDAPSVVSMDPVQAAAIERRLTEPNGTSGWQIVASVGLTALAGYGLYRAVRGR